MHRWSAIAPEPRNLAHPVHLDRKGVTGPTPDQAKGPGWRRTSRGWYVPASVSDELPEQRIVEQAARLPPAGAVTGWAGCRLHRVNLLDGLEDDGRTRRPVPLLVGSGGRIRADAGVRLVYSTIPAWEVERVHGVNVARLVRCVFDAVRLAADERQAVVALDAVLATRLISPERVAAYAASHRRAGGIRMVDFALRSCRERVRSPAEVRVRLIAELDAGFPPLAVNRVVVSMAGQRLGEVDLLDEETGLVVEFDGADHRTRERHTLDVGKQEALLTHGLEVCRVTGTDLRSAPAVAQRLRTARQRALRLARPKRWRLQPSGPSIEEELTEREELALFAWEVAELPVLDVRSL